MICNDVKITIEPKKHHGVDGEGTMIDVAPALATWFGKFRTAPGRRFAFTPTAAHAVEITENACDMLTGNMPLDKVAAALADSEMTLLQCRKRDACRSEDEWAQIEQAQINLITLEQMFIEQYGDFLFIAIRDSAEKAHRKLQSLPV